jgi:hypothetical protein
MNRKCGYEHTQKGIIQPLMLLIGTVILAGAWFFRAHPALPVCFAGALACFLIPFVFGRLTVRDEDDRLGVRFGPIPLLRKTIPYVEITAAEKDRSTLLAGWGIHWTRKGWLWNIVSFRQACMNRTGVIGYALRRFQTAEDTHGTNGSSGDAS